MRRGVKMSEEVLIAVKEFVKKEFEKPEAQYKDSLENHFKIVVRYVLELVEDECADREIVEIAAWLHDIGSIMGQYENHHVVSAEVAGDLLARFGYSKDKIEEVKHCILTHRGSLGLGKETKEARILADADAMSHFDCIENITSKIFDGDKKKTLAKLERSYVKLSDKAKPLIFEKLEAARRELG